MNGVGGRMSGSRLKTAHRDAMNGAQTGLVSARDGSGVRVFEASCDTLNNMQLCGCTIPGNKNMGFKAKFVNRRDLAFYGAPVTRSNH